MTDSQLRLKYLLTTYRGQDNVLLDPRQPRLTLNLNPQNLALWRSEFNSIAEKDTNLLLACNSSTGILEDTTLTWVVGAAIRPASAGSRESCSHLLTSLGLESGLVESILTHCPGIAEDVVWALYYDRNKRLCVSPVINDSQDLEGDHFQQNGKIQASRPAMDARFQQMISKARILGLGYDHSLPESIRTIFQQADASGRLLTSAEIEDICSIADVNPSHLNRLQQRAPLIVAAAKDRLLQEEPGLIEPGGALYPHSRADACWRDCWHFLRIAIYAVAANRPSFTHPPGVESLAELYAELEVPINSMARAMSMLRSEAHNFYSSIASEKDCLLLDQSLQHLEQMIQQLAGKPSAAQKSLV